MNTEQYKYNRKKYLWILLLFIVFIVVWIAAFNRIKGNMSKADKKSLMIQDSLAGNPYATEVIGELYLFCMYEADEGGVVSNDLFADESEYTYYQKYDLIGNNNKPMDSEWKINLAKMKGNDVLAQSVNEYHRELYNREKEKMKKRQKEVIANSREISYMEPEGYTGNVRTAGAFEWGNILTVIDMSGNTLNSCVEMPANFNKATGKRYEISDLFNTDDYREALVKIAADYYADGITWGQSWSKALEHGYPLTFAITCKGLLLGDGYKERTALIRWEDMRDILSPEFAEEVLVYSDWNND